jgi:hypothetical protein
MTFDCHFFDTPEECYTRKSNSADLPGSPSNTRKTFAYPAHRTPEAVPDPGTEIPAAAAADQSPGPERLLSPQTLQRIQQRLQLHDEQ